MPVFFFSIRHGESASIANDGAEFSDHNAAWKEMTGVCGAMIADVSRKLPENTEWQMELLDESRQPVLRIRLVAETLQDTDPKARSIALRRSPFWKPCWRQRPARCPFVVPGPR